MIQTDKLRGIIAEKKLTQPKVAKHLGVTPKTFYSKMSKGVFRSDEIDAMIDLLQIEDPEGIFFAKKVT